jgi:hypothetical protein
MEQQFSDMQALLKGDARAWKYYNMLRIRSERISARTIPEFVHSTDYRRTHSV